jgi:hypothetical protein
MTDKDISRHLDISHHTVSLHIREAMRRLGAPTRKAALRKLAEEPLYAPTAIPAAAVVAPSPNQSGEEAGAGGGLRTEAAMGQIPPPPTSGLIRLAIVLGFAAVAALATTGIVFAISGAVITLESYAPSTSSPVE